MKSEFWEGKRVLITGHTGFKGSWLSLWLQTLGARLRGIALMPPTYPSLFDVARVQQNMEHCIVDIRDFEAVKKTLNEFNPEIIIHMAAQPLVRLSYESPIETYETNIMGTIHVLEAARNCSSLKAIVNVTTDKCYENLETQRGYRETDRLGGRDPYASSKACAEIVSRSYRESFLANAGISIATVRAGNVIGGGDWASDRLVPDILRALENRDCVAIRNPNAIRPWQHVLEPLAGYLELAEKLYVHGKDYAEGWNFGPNSDDICSVKWVVEKLYSIWGENSAWTVQGGDHPYEAGILKLDITKATSRLNWSPRWTLDIALEKISAWHQAWIDGKDMRIETLRQITEFTEARN